MNSGHVPKKSSTYDYDDFGSASIVVYESEEFGLVATTYRDFCANPQGFRTNPKEEFRRANPELFVDQQQSKSGIEVSRQLGEQMSHRDHWDEGQVVVGQGRDSTGLGSGGSFCSGSFDDTTKKLRIGTRKVKPRKELDSIVTEFVTTKHSRTRVFAGAKKSPPIIPVPVKSLIRSSTSTTATTLTAKITVPKLTELSTKTVEANVDHLIGLEKLTTPMLLTLLKKVSVKQLEGIERNNPGIRDKTNEVWKMKYSRNFKSMRFEVGDETKWRDAYQAAAKERKASFKNSVKVKIASATSTTRSSSTSNSGGASVSTLPTPVQVPVPGGRVKSEKVSATTPKRKISSCDDVFSIFEKRDDERHASKCRRLKSRSDSEELPRRSPAKSAKGNLF